VEQVCVDDHADVVDLLSSLIDKSLVQRVGVDAPQAHFAMLQSVRDFASDQLAESGEGDSVADRHMRLFATRAVLGESRIGTNSESLWWESVSEYEGDTRAARRHALRRGEIDAVLELTTGLAWTWYLSGHIGAAQGAIR